MNPGRRAAALVLMLATVVAGAVLPCPCAPAEAAATPAHHCCAQPGPALRADNPCCLVMGTPTVSEAALPVPAALFPAAVAGALDFLPLSAPATVRVAATAPPPPSPPLVLRV